MSKHHREHNRFAEQQRQKNTATEQRAAQTMRDMHAATAKVRGKTQKATAKRQGR
ncbi:hypothetical protein GL263_10780 [Streptomyces durbertensis]|uniref:Uncharacterized protein n=1 Tax=Streptomyces durbertensis TaxID=2448886 RepID=A0ABR6EFD4_9ACTN|nr:hypothetical protein [Streptomyces durbertensis]MBB1244039.1 hypothetical protein [Streptomyces durbertensis]